MHALRSSCIRYSTCRRPADTTTRPPAAHHLSGVMRRFIAEQRYRYSATAALDGPGP
jgi:hypothetical protein